MTAPSTQERGRLGGMSKAELDIQRSREMIAEAKAASRPAVNDHAVTPKRAVELRAYWTAVKEISERTDVDSATKRRVLDDWYRHTFPKVVPW